ncbi:MAG: hypothetical protein IH977_04310 [Nitrospinae bacterium]|nr:hypothetical protein [Nitrospinota bacterium]
MEIDNILDHAEQRQRADDVVASEQAKLAPVRAWADTQEKEFLAAERKLRPRVQKALIRLNRLTALVGAPLSEPRRLWEEMEKIRTGIPMAYRGIIQQIDTLTPYLAGQPNYMVPLRGRLHCPPGTIGNFVRALEALEQTLEEFAASMEKTSPPATVGLIPVERQASQGPPVENDFTP